MSKFIGIEIAFAIYYDQISIFGGPQSVCDQGLLELAIGQAQQTYAYTKDIYEAASQYGLSSAKNPPASRQEQAYCRGLYADLSGHERNRANADAAEQLFKWILQVAVGELDRAGLAELLHPHSRRKR